MLNLYISLLQRAVTPGPTQKRFGFITPVKTQGGGLHGMYGGLACYYISRHPVCVSLCHRCISELLSKAKEDKNRQAEEAKRRYTWM